MSLDDNETLEATRLIVESELEAGWASLERGDLIDGDEAIEMLRRSHAAYRVADPRSSD